MGTRRRPRASARSRMAVLYAGSVGARGARFAKSCSQSSSSADAATTRRAPRPPRLGAPKEAAAPNWRRGGGARGRAGDRRRGRGRAARSAAKRCHGAARESVHEERHRARAGGVCRRPPTRRAFSRLLRIKFRAFRASTPRAPERGRWGCDGAPVVLSIPGAPLRFLGSMGKPKMGECRARRRVPRTLVCVDRVLLETSLGAEARARTRVGRGTTRAGVRIVDANVLEKRVCWRHGGFLTGAPRETLSWARRDV